MKGNTNKSPFSDAITDFNRGMRCDIDPNDASGIYPVLLKNIHLGQKGSLVTRPGRAIAKDVTTITDYSGGGSVDLDETDFGHGGAGVPITGTGELFIRFVAAGKMIDVYPDNSTYNNLYYLALSPMFVYETVTGTVTADAVGRLVDLNLTAGTLTSATNNCVCRNMETGEVVGVTWLGSTHLTTDHEVDWPDPVELRFYSKVRFDETGNYMVGSGDEDLIKRTGTDLDGDFSAKYLTVSSDRLFMADFYTGWGFGATYGRQMIVQSQIVDGSIIDGTAQIYKVNGLCAADADTAGANTVTITTSIFTADMVNGYIWNSSNQQLYKILAFTSATVVETDNDTSMWDNDPVYVIHPDDVFLVPSDVTGIKHIGEYLAGFDLYALYLIDFNNASSRKFPGRGCQAHDTIALSDDNDLFWLGTNGIYMMPTSGSPVRISDTLTNKATGEDIFSLINYTNHEKMFGSIVNDEYWLYVGDLTGEYHNQTLTDVVLVYNIASASWRVESHPLVVVRSGLGRFMQQATYILSNENPVLYKLDPQGEDAIYDSTNTTPVDWMVIYEDLIFKSPTKSKTADFIIRYKADAAITVEVKTNDMDEYDTVATLEATEGEYLSVPIIFSEPGQSYDLRISGSGYVDISSINFNGEMESIKEERK